VTFRFSDGYEPFTVGEDTLVEAFSIALTLAQASSNVTLAKLARGPRGGQIGGGEDLQGVLARLRRR
jgi:hypothetical protein